MAARRLRLHDVAVPPERRLNRNENNANEAEEMDSEEEENERKIAEKERVMKMKARYGRALRVNRMHDDRNMPEAQSNAIMEPKLIGEIMFLFRFFCYFVILLVTVFITIHIVLKS